MRYTIRRRRHAELITELPASLAPAEPMARAVYERGWRAPHSEGPTRDELVDLLEAAVTNTSATS